MKGLIVAALLLLLLAAPPAVAAEEAPAPSVLVATVPAQRGAEPDILTAYGSATPTPGSTTIVSLPRAGQVLEIDARLGQKVTKGEKLLAFGADAASVMAWNQAVAGLNLAREERAHTEQLLKQQLATRSQLAQADKAVADAQAALDAQRRQGGGEPVQAVAAPFDAIVTAIPVNAGDRVQAGAPLMTLLRADALSVTIGVEPGDRARLRSDESVRLEPLDGGAAVEGRIASVGAILAPTTRKIEAVVSVPPDSVLPGEAFRAAITTGEFQGWIVPRSAVLNDGKEDYLFQTADGKAVRIAVHILGTNGGKTIVDGPLDPARPVVVEGNYQLSDGMAVRGPDDKPDQARSEKPAASKPANNKS